jgi:flagellar hook protein FlgE
MESTGNTTDLAIQGDALFVVKDSTGFGQFYTRAGAFEFNKNKILTNPDGYEVQGFGITNGAANGTLGKIDLTGFASMPANKTTKINIIANLDASQTTPATAWTPAAPGFDPNAASNFSTTSTVYDALGNTSSVSSYFRNTGANTWDAYTYDGTAYSAATAVTFNASGALTAGSTLTTAGGLTINLTGTTQYASSSVINTQTQDGFAAGSLQNVTVDQQGFVTGNYTNGQQMKIAQVALARFASAEGLEKLGGSLYAQTPDSGVALIDSSNSNSNKVLANSLEQSNVDMTSELVKLITTQRAYTANSKTISSSDQMMQDTLNLVR